MKQFLKTTVIGGALFLLPLALVLVILGHAMRIAVQAALPVSHWLHFDEVGKIAGVGIVTILAAILLVLVSFLAGVVARTRVGANASAWFENSFLGGMPQYQMVKSMAQGLAQAETASDEFKPVLVSAEGGWQIGYLLEALENNWMVVFVPQAPTPLVGNVRYYPGEHVRPLDITMLQARTIVKNIGIGSAAALRGQDLRSSPT
ncbi:DUF502 domain-containing protein [Bradyrhizobium sp. 1(2017)]|jgi:uncharacterized membrane protein|uniref:DUF502 domain-containing protein n=1 Tax=Bradyrhizobium sp. 1(2017) TaxID=1404888 RepID=UPI00140F2D9F|nr:DUF502 domain-containing protein [Bradyrhizobium sp. 1(2017)]QIO31805.1 DUF502 domain-containing protein [Bradyrhizobium sp. 1(2017)]